MITSSPHPSLQQLEAFRRGKLSWQDLAVIEEHVGGCSSCCESLKNIPDDDLIGLIRKSNPPADQSVASTPMLGAGELTHDHLPVPPEREPDVPPDLAQHPTYRVVELLGAGGMGAVYRAEHRLMERTVALKVLRKSLMEHPGAVERFRQEVKAAARLSHRNIVTAHDAGQAGDTHFLVMEYVEGMSLAKLVSDKGPLPVEEACDYVRQAALGLQHAHERGMVHRDIKPHNLMIASPESAKGVEKKPVVKILDFGLASLVSESKPNGAVTPVGMVLGTPDYIAPEQALDAHKADIRADIYSLGCSLYFLLTGHAPYPEGTTVQKVMAHMEQPATPLTHYRRDVPSAVLRVLSKMMAKKPEQRYQTPREVVQALKSLSSLESVKPVREEARPMWPWLVAGGVAMSAMMFLAVVIVIWITVRVRSRPDEMAATIVIDNDKAEVKVEQPAKVEAPAQAKPEQNPAAVAVNNRGGLYGDQGGEPVLPDDPTVPNTIMRARADDTFYKLSNPRLSRSRFGFPALVVEYEVTRVGKHKGASLVIHDSDGRRQHVILFGPLQDHGTLQIDSHFGPWGGFPSNMELYLARTDGRYGEHSPTFKVSNSVTVGTMTKLTKPRNWTREEITRLSQPPPNYANANAHPGVGFDTPFAGDTTGGGLFRFVEPGGLLLGLDYRLGEWDGEKCFGGLAPVFSRTQPVAVAATRILAKDGYAIAGVKVHSKRYVDALQITFMRIAANAKLDASDVITSDWIGFPDEKTTVTVLGGDGTRVIGIHNRSGAILNGLALVLEEAPKKNPIVQAKPDAKPAVDPRVDPPTRNDPKPKVEAGPKVEQRAELIPPPKLEDQAVNADPKPPEVVVLTAEQRSLADKARKVLENHCHRCHGKDGAVEGGFNFLLDRDRLVVRNKVVPGDARKSRLFKRVHSEEMPPEDEKQRPSKDEIDTLRQWIDGGAPDFGSASAERTPLRPARVLELICDDLKQHHENDRRFIRYFTFAHLYNSDVSDDELRTYRDALSKLVNSLSWGQKVVPPFAIDPARVIFRIDLRDYRWNEKTWEDVISLNPYGIDYRTPESHYCAEATACALPYVRGDWFVSVASQPPLYHKILEIPQTAADLEKLLRVDVAENYRIARAARAGFNGSGVSRNNRVVERHESVYGAYWKSYDFAGNSGRQNVFAHPLGPTNDANHFQHDGGEIIFNLPNGLQAYMLVDGKGQRIDKGPTSIVSDPKQPDRAVLNGISCMSCHARGIIDKEDQVRAHVNKNLNAFSKSEADQILNLYLPREKFSALVREDAERFRLAVEKTGARFGGAEPIVAMAQRFDAELDVKLAAAECGMTVDDFNRMLARSDTLVRSLGALRTVGGTVQREAWVLAFPEIVIEFRIGITIGKPVDPAKLAARLPVPAELTQTLLDLKAADHWRRKGAAERLAKMEPKEGREVVALTLASILDDPDHFTRQALLAAIAVWSTKETVPAVIKMTTHKDIFTRKAAVTALGKIKDPRGADAVAARVGAGLESHDAAKALEAMGPVAEDATLKLLDHAEWSVRRTICTVLKVIGTRKSIAPLQKATQDSNSIVAGAAEDAWKAIAQRVGEK